MSLLSRLASMLAQLPRASTHDVVVVRNLRIPLPDGVELLCDRYYPNIAGADQLPIMLHRTPYGRIGSGLLARLFAERGYQVVVVSCRGTFGSGGGWEPFFNERSDGHAVASWLSKQPWFSGNVGTFGASYHGLTQWAVAGQPPAFLRCMSLAVTQSNFAPFIRPNGSFALESALTWIRGLEYQELPWMRSWSAIRQAEKRLPQALRALPLSNADSVLVGRRKSFYQDWIANDDQRGPYWSRIDFAGDLADMPPAVLIAGWYDIFGALQIQDYINLRKAGRPARLIVGPWHHMSPGGLATWLRETLRWMNIHLRGAVADSSDTVRVFVMGSRRWVSFPEWPVPATQTSWHFHADGILAQGSPTASAPDRYRYDPADPTPVAGGASLYIPHAGVRDNRAVEARPDVLCYTSDVLENDLTVIGPIRATLYARSSLDHMDFFVRVCNVEPNGRSLNLCDGIVRLSPADIRRAADGSFEVRLELSPTANTFRRGHRIRVQVASGAFPLYARNPGTGEPLDRAQTLVAAEQEILHDPQHPSAVELPVVSLPMERS